MIKTRNDAEPDVARIAAKGLMGTFVTAPTRSEKPGLYRAFLWDLESLHYTVADEHQSGGKAFGTTLWGRPLPLLLDLPLSLFVDTLLVPVDIIFMVSKEQSTLWQTETAD